MSLRDSIMNLVDRCENPLDLLTDISLNCNDEVLIVCERIREELSNPEMQKCEVDIGGLFGPFDINLHIEEEANERTSVAKKYLGNQKEWIND
jgi:hypothetical protein